MTTPPRIARWILRRVLPIDIRDELIGDLDEEYARHARPHGAVRGRWWYWKQAVGALPRLAGRDVAHDVRCGIRALRRNLGFSLTAITMLAVGIGATTAMFSIVHAALIRPLPYPAADELVRLRPVRPGAEQHRFTFSEGEFLTYEERSATFAGLAAFEDDTSSALSSSDRPMQVTGAQVTANLFDVLGVVPARGRGFTAQEDAPGGPDVVVISHGLWQQMFAADERIVGRTIDLDARPTTIVGVMPAGFQFPNDETALWSPLALDRVEVGYQSGQILQVIGRRHTGVDPARVQDDLDRISAQITDEALTRYPGMSARAVAWRDDVADGIGSPLLLLLGVVGVVLVLVCLNLAGYLAAQSVARERELAVRMALGASAGRIVRQLVSESAVLAAAGGLAGGLLASLVMGAVNAARPPFLDAVGDVALDPAVMAFATAATTASVLLFGLSPARQAMRRQQAGALGGARGARGTRAGQRFLAGLVLVQIAACVVLLVGAGLMLQSLARERAVDPGFAVDGVLTFRVELPSERYPDGADTISFYERAIDQIAALPFVRQAGAITRVPMNGSRSIGYGWQEGKPVEPGAFPQELNMRWATTGYFEAMDIELLRGRLFDDGHVAGTPLVAVVSESLAEALWPGENAVGKRFKLGRLVNDSTPWRSVLGVVEDVRLDGLRDDGGAPTAYFAYKQRAPSGMNLIVRLDGTGARGPIDRGAASTQVVDAVRAAIAAVDADQPIYDVRFMRQIVADTTAMTRYSTLLLSGFAALALALAAIGLYSLVAFSTRQRFAEFGVRRALGATEGGILRLVIGRAARLALVGVATGIGVAIVATRLLEGLVFGVATTDPATFALTAAAVGLVAIAAALRPALQATRIDPRAALR